jgi:hypothetical protein
MAGRLPSLLCVAVAVIVLGQEHLARAQVGYRVGVGASVGVTDNPRSQPEGGDTQGDGFAAARGTAAFNHVGALSRQEAVYSIAATSWFREIRAPMLTQTLNLSSEIDAAPDLRIGLAAGATMTQLTMIDTTVSAVSPAPQTAGPRPTGEQRFVTFDARQSLSYEWGGSWRLSQGFGGYLLYPLGSETTLGETKGLAFHTAIHHLWARDQAGLNGRAAVATTSGPAAPPWRTSEFAQLQVSWRHEWTPDISNELAAGATAVKSDRVRVLPSGSASVSWRGTGRDLEVRAARSAEASMFLGVVYERNVVGLLANLQIDQLETVGLMAAADLEHDSALADSTGQGGSANVFFARLALHWRPSNMVDFGIEYNFRDQRSAVTGSGSSAMPTFRRQMAVLTIEMRFPDDRR